MGSPTLLNVGFDNAVAVERIIAVVSAESSPIKRLREAASRHQKLIDATNGRRTRTVIITDSDHVVLSSLQPETVAQRLTEVRGIPHPASRRDRAGGMET
jgi:regulator of extracellular matrix RemA (YlzA/DUF370 family)